jgi:pimeloyl-ACP methyl ester carboxylesterase
VPTFTAPDGTRLAYHPRGDGEPLVVLPGGPMRASAYLGDLGGLAAHRRLILLDLRGTGESAPPDDPATYRCDRMVDDVEALRTHMGLARMDVLGHSAGGSLAMLYAARYPARVRRLALVTATPWALGLAPAAEDRLAAARLRAGEPWFAEAFPAFAAWVAGTGDFGRLCAPFFHGRWDESARRLDARGDEEYNDEAFDVYGSEGAFDPPATRAALARLTSPVLVLAGEVDAGTPPGLARRACEAFPDAEFTVQPGAGHYPWLDDPEWFVRRVVAFLEGTGPSSLPSADQPGTARLRGYLSGMDIPLRTVKANGITLAYRAWGPENAPPVLLLHCRGADGSDWTRIADAFATGPRPRRVYAPDLRGHGRSDWPGAEPGAGPEVYRYEAMRDDVRGFLAALGIGRADVVGHSLGGAVACLLAQRAPGTVRRLVLEDVPAPIPLHPPRPPAERPDGDLPFDWAMVRATDEQRNAPDPVWWDHMGRITMPTLLIGGGATSLVPQEQIAALAELIPDARQVTIDAGHLVHETRPEEFLAVVEAFLTE